MEHNSDDTGVRLITAGCFKYRGKEQTYVLLHAKSQPFGVVYDLLCYERESTSSTAEVISRDISLKLAKKVIADLEKDL